MNAYGKAFKIIRKVRDIDLKDAAIDPHMSEATLRRLEEDETQVVSPLFEQMLIYYKIDYKTVFELAAQPVAEVQNVIHTMTGEKAIGIQNVRSKENSELEKKMEALEARIQKI